MPAKTEKKADKPKEAPKMAKEEEIGFHKGALSVLAKEREEMARIITIVEQIMNMHVQKLKELGVDLGQGSTWASPKGIKKPIDDLI